MEWWNQLTSFEKIFWIIAIPATVAFIIQLVTTFLGGDIDADLEVDTEIETDHGAGVQFFTVKNLIAFFTIFAWTGIACIDAGLSKGLVVFIAFLAGLAMMTIMATIFYYANKLTENGSLDLKNALGAEGEVYLTIPANKGGYGKIQIKVQGALRELEAVTTDNVDLKTGSIAKVIDVSTNNILTVTKN